MFDHQHYTKYTEVECKQCGRKFVRLQQLQTHALVHVPQDQRPIHQCDKCDKTFKHPNSFRRHQRTGHKE